MALHCKKRSGRGPWWIPFVIRGPVVAPGGSSLSLDVKKLSGWLPTVTRGQEMAPGGSAL